MAAITSPAASAAGKRLEGKVALITGAASGIGESAARLFSLHGAKIVIADIQDDLGQGLAADLGGPGHATYVHCDVTDEKQVCAAVEVAVAVYGQLDIMYCNAGAVDQPGPLVDVSKASFERILGVNVMGGFLGTKHAARVMINSGRGTGSIVLTASIASVVGGAATYAYTCAKHAVVGLVKNAAVELGQYGIRVNCVSPYGVATKLAMGVVPSVEGVNEFQRATEAAGNLKNRFLKAEDIAAAALYLASDDAKYVSGHNLLVDGGFTIVNSSVLQHQNNRI